MKKSLLIITLLLSSCLFAQVGINTTNPKAQLDIKASNQVAPQNTDGILIPRIDAFPVTNPTVDQNGMLIFLTTDNKFYYWKNATSTWIVISDATNNVEKIDDLTDGKSDNNGSSVFLGVYAGLNDDQSDNKNVGIGFRSLKNNTTGNRNVATGYYSLQSNTTGSENDASGYYSLYSNTTGYHNIALGNQSLQSNTTGYNNIGIGCLSLADNTTSTNNLAIGYLTLPQNTTGSYNVALGNESARINTTGSYNVANGYYSLQLNTTGSNNTALGNNSGYNSLGNANIFLGNRSGYFETGSNKLYIENSNANSSNALIYGEFGSNNTTTGNILRTNSEFQIGDPSTSGYKFPTARGTANQVLQSDATGVLTWQDGSDLGAQKIDDLTDGKSDNDGTQDGSSVFLGVNAGLNDDQSDNKNVGIGFESMKSNVDGFVNASIGFKSLSKNISGGGNAAFGSVALLENTTGFRNTAIGNAALRNNITGQNNTAVGVGAGYNSIRNRNVFLGYKSGYNEVGNDKLYIENSDTDADSALIYGEFDNDLLRVNGKLEFGEIGNNNYLEIANLGNFNLGLNGDLIPYNNVNYDLGNNTVTEHWDEVVANTFVSFSDKRTKNNISNLNLGLNEIMLLNPISYQYKKIISANNRTRFGLIAQEVEKIIPQIVINDDVDVNPKTGEVIRKKGEYKALSYTELIPVLIKATQEQQEIIKNNKTKNKLLKEKITSLEKRLLKIEELLNNKN